MSEPENSTVESDDNWKWDMITQSVYGSSILSIVASTAVLVAYGFMFWLRPAQANRISLRLSVIIAFSDIFYAIFLLVSNIPSVTAGPTCTSSVYLQFAFELLSLFATAAIALNLLMVFVFRMEAKKRLERWYYGVGGVLAFGLPLIALLAGRLGWDEVNEECWVKSVPNESQASTMAWKWGILYFWVSGISLFCTGVTILVYFFLKRTGIPLPTTESSPSNPNNTVLFRRTQRIIQRAVSRIVVYCLVPIISQFWNIVLDGLLEAGIDDWWVYLLANIFSGLQGTFNALIFFTIDPAVSNIREELRRRIIKKYYLTTLPQTLSERLIYTLIQKTLLRKRDLKQASMSKSSASVLQSETRTRPSQLKSEDGDLVQHVVKPGHVESGVAREGEADVIAFL
ncbi:hypothetical protein SpCBS45565_g04430 [Spizellomyces sp. 'palustris']|nr:hypothetical protein SpCBS45565_g04430 [Spizellomyces sp. 'palustris']